MERVINKMKFSKWRAQSFSDKLFDIINYSVLTLLAIVCLYPLYYVVIISFSTDVAGVYFWPNGFSTLGYETMFKDKDVWIGYRNTIFYTIGGVLFSLLLTLPCAYTLSRDDVPGKKYFTHFLLVTMFLSGGLIPTYLTVNSFGIVNTWYVVIVMTGVSTYNVMVARTFFKTTIPNELLEAASMDGCGNGLFFVKIVLPLSKPIVAVLALWIGVGRWNSYFTEMVYLRDDAKYPLALYLRKVLWEISGLNEMIRSGLEEVEVTADLLAQVKLVNILQYVIIVCAFTPMMIIYPFIQKYFSKGVMIGSVKG